MTFWGKIGLGKTVKKIKKSKFYKGYTKLGKTVDKYAEGRIKETAADLVPFYEKRHEFGNILKKIAKDPFDTDNYIDLAIDSGFEMTKLLYYTPVGIAAYTAGETAGEVAYGITKATAGKEAARYAKLGGELLGGLAVKGKSLDFIKKEGKLLTKAEKMKDFARFAVVDTAGKLTEAPFADEVKSKFENAALLTSFLGGEPNFELLEGKKDFFKQKLHSSKKQGCDPSTDNCVFKNGQLVEHK